MSQVELSKNDLSELLEEQLLALKTSAATFDHGQTWEAKRIATAIRTLVHATQNSKSLLGQLGLEDRGYVTSVPPIDRNNLMPQSELTLIGIKQNEATFLAALDDRSMEFVDLKSWWTGEVIWDRDNPPFSRKDLVLHMANKDGGAHVDPRIPEAYHKLKSGMMGWQFTGKAARQPERFAMRQIGHEMIKSLDPAYARSPTKDGFNMVVGGMFAKIEGGPPLLSDIKNYRDTPDSDACPCRSGRAFANCHKVGAPAGRLVKAEG